jgi:RHS repeat-associated protein
MYPDGRDDRTYTYTNRNQLKTISEYGGWLVATYTYDVNGNIATRVPHGGANSTYSYDPLDRVTRIVHAFTDTTRTFDYDYDSVGNRLHVERDDSYKGDAFAYDLADQVTAAQLNVSNIWSVDPDPTIVYDANGNRTSFGAYGTTDTYGAVNNLNQYTTRTVAGNTTTASYDNNANMTAGLDTSAYTFDAQNRLTTASKNGLTVTFIYDALNRVVTRSFSDGRRYDNIWDGWNLILTYDGSNNWIVAPTHGPNGIEHEYNTTTHTTEMIFKDASGSTTHLGNADTGQLDEWYRYDLDGTPLIYAPDGSSRTASLFDIRHYFTGQQWYSDLGLYDLRNRFYSPNIGRFLQPDPVGFGGDATNLYRYAGNNPLKYLDPTGTAYEAESGPGLADDYFDELPVYEYQQIFVNGEGVGGGRGDFSIDLPGLLNNDFDPISFTPGGGLPSTDGGSDGPFKLGQDLPPLPGNVSPPPPWAPAAFNPQPFTLSAATTQPIILPNTTNPIVDWLRNNTNYTVDFAKTLGVVPVFGVPVPLGVHGFVTIDKTGVTMGGGPGIVAGSGVIAVLGHPFGQSSGVELVSQIFGAGPVGGYVSGMTPITQGGSSSFTPGVGIGTGSALSITVDGTWHFNWPDGN